MNEVKTKIIDESMDLVEKVYDDGVSNFVEESGKTLSLVPKAINAALVPLRKWIAEREFTLKETEKLLEKKLRNIDANDIIEPESYVAVPAIQAISYSMNNEILRNMYGNLLARAMNINTKDSVHPSFVEIIKQMSPNDAKIYKEIYKSGIRPVIDLSVSFNNTTGNDHHKYNITWINEFDYKTVSVSISNLTRTGLIEVVSDASYTDDANYNMVRNTVAYIEYNNTYSKVPNAKVEEDRHFIKVTALGELFYSICVKD